jgi:hypothetical protein
VGPRAGLDVLEKRKNLSGDINVIKKEAQKILIYRAYTKEWCGFNSVHY